MCSLINSQNHSQNLADSLSQREIEILACLADGLSNQEIANRLHLALRTVKWYNSQIYRKLGVSNRSEAAEQAGRLNLGSIIPDAQSRHNLPHQLTPFIGRHQELTDLSHLFNKPDIRLITILAPGGMGKTQLALAAARQQLGRFTDGVYFVPLASLSAPSSITTAIADSIGFGFHGEDSIIQQLISYLKDRSMLLILDNFEHLLNGATLVSDILHAALGVCILATSRERLNLHGELVYPLSGLDFPGPKPVEDALEFDAIRLFTESAKHVRADFTLQPGDLDAVTRICQMTDGMPLGIELAAGWVDVLSLQQIITELQRGLDILETDLHDVPERHRSIRGTFERTWIRLSDDQRAVFGRLSVFSGGFSLTAAQSVAKAEIGHLRLLAQKALIQLEQKDRFTIHELLRQFGRDKLDETGELLAIQARHAAYFSNFMTERKQEIKTDRQLEAIKLIDLDFENVRLAWIYSVRIQQWELVSHSLHSLWFYCHVRTRGQEALDLLKQAEIVLRMASPSFAVELALGRVLALLGWYYNDAGFSEKGAAACDEAIQLLRLHGDPEDLIAALFYRQNVAFDLFQPDVAVTLAEEGLKIAQSIGDKYWEGHLLLWAGAGSQNGLEVVYRQTRQFSEKALTIFENLGNRWGMMRALKVLGQAYHHEQKLELAKKCFEQVLSIAKSFQHPLSISGGQAGLARIAQDEGDLPAAHMRWQKVLEEFWQAGYTWLTPYPLRHIADLYTAQNELDLAVSILGTIHDHPLRMGQTDQKAQVLHRDLSACLGSERFNNAWVQGTERTLNQLIVEMLSKLQPTKS